MMRDIGLRARGASRLCACLEILPLMSPEFINNIATFAGVLVAALGAFLFAFWVAMGIWAFNDIRARSRDWLAIVLAVLLVMVFPLVGLILYTLIRPKSTLADVYDRALEEEALLRELEETHACQACGVPVKDTWIFCPNCHTQLQHTCPACSNLVRNEWAICVYCGTPQRPAVGAPAGARAVAPELTGERPVLGPSQPQALPLGATPGAYAAQSGYAPSTSAYNAQSGYVSSPPAAARRPSRNPFARESAPPPEQTPPVAPDVDDEDGFYRPA
jgi:hypothetical protein